MRLKDLLKSPEDPYLITDIRTKGGILLDFLVCFFHNLSIDMEIMKFFEEGDHHNVLDKISDTRKLEFIELAKADLINEDLLSNIKEDNDGKLQYLYFINRKINFRSIINNIHDRISILKTFGDLLTERELSDIVIFLNNYIGRNNVDKKMVAVTKQSLFDEFHEYIQLRNINDKVFISYYASFINTNSFHATTRGGEYLRKIELMCDSSILSNINLRTDYFLNLIDQTKLELFDNINNKIIQFHGIVDKENLFFIDLKESLRDCLKTIDNTHRHKHNYSQKSLDIDKCMSYLKLMFLMKYQYVKNGKAEKSALQIEFDEIIDYNSDFKKFLISKSFNEYEVNIIFNLLSQNRYKDCGIKYLSNLKQVDFFRLCYIFHVFDFYTTVKKHEFKSRGSFEVILNFDKKNEYSLDSLEQIRKYYFNIDDKNSKHYVFNGHHKIINDVINQLGISGDRLKMIPN